MHGPMRPELPSLIALQALDAALRHENFSRAAAELHRTQGAISRQVAALEDQLGVLLFHRDHPRVVPTPTARRYGTQVRAILDRLAAATLEAKSGASHGGVLHLAILPTFGTRWLIPRIPDFYAAHPDVGLELTSRIGLFDFEVELLDAAIHYGEGLWPGARVAKLLDEEVAVVCSPDLAAGAPLETIDDLAATPLLQLQSRPNAWRAWFEAKGKGSPAARAGAVFEHHLMVVQAAVASLGVALVPTFLVVEELASGTLIEPLAEGRAKTDSAYWLAYPERSATLPALRALRTWLSTELS